MFKDSVKLRVTSGKGGAGCVAFRREKFVLNGGPNGGDGGKGGDIIFRCDNNTHAFSHFHNNMHIKAENGRPGMGSNMTGKSAPAKIIPVPPGTQIIDEETQEVLADLVDDGQEVVLLKGGKGGLGNTHFKSPTNQRPTYAQPGESGQSKLVRLELKLIADVGLVGFPNVGKSTLISVVSNAKPEIANYEFTTLTPKLGQVDIGDYESFVMADIPGIIGGASDGKGLGIEFLKHIERTKTLLFMIDLASYRTLQEQIDTLKEEVSKFSEKLASSAYAIALTRIDIIPLEEREKIVKEFIEALGLKQTDSNRFDFVKELPYFIQESADATLGFNKDEPYFILPISSVANINIEPLKYALFDLVAAQREHKED